jgi:hypothetical protein
VEYRHVDSRTDRAQHGIGPSTQDDTLALYAEAFERDADPADFPLEALIAHECGHQRLLRNQGLRTILARFPSEPFEEFLASLLGSLLPGESGSAQALVWKATADLRQLGLGAAGTVRLIERLRRLLRFYL